MLAPLLCMLDFDVSAMSCSATTTTSAGVWASGLVVSQVPAGPAGFQCIRVRGAFQLQLAIYAERGVGVLPYRPGAHLVHTATC